MAPPRTIAVFVLGALWALSPALSADQRASATAQAMSLLRKAQQVVAGSVTVTSLALEGRQLPLPAFIFARGGGEPDTAGARTAEWLFMLPDRYRSTSIGASELSYRGFSGERPLLGAKSLSPGVKVGVGAPGLTFIPAQRVVAARLLLGILGTIDGPLRLNVALDPSGSLRVTGPNDFECFVDLDPASAAPLRVRYFDTVGFAYSGTTGQVSGDSGGGGSGARGGSGGIRGGSGSGRSFSSGPPERAEISITFDDRRRVGGVLMPHRITTTARSIATGNEETREEIRFERVTVNPPLTVEDIEREL